MNKPLSKQEERFAALLYGIIRSHLPTRNVEDLVDEILDASAGEYGLSTFLSDSDDPDLRTTGLAMNLFALDVPRPPRAGKYQVLYPDPPWPERGGGKIKRGADKHYDLMSVDAIVDLFETFGTWAAEDAHLYLWATNNYLPAAFRCVEAARFRYVTMTTWVKDRPGLGQYFRGQTEHCLFAVRGRLPYRTKPDGTRAQGRTVFYEVESVDEPPSDLPEAFEAPVPTTAAGARIHSRKPQKMRDYIELVSGDVARLELFARIATPGFDRWGLEAPDV